MSADRYIFFRGRARGVGDPISLKTFHHPHKKHFFGVWKDDTDYDPAKPFMPLPKIKLRVDRFPELNFKLVQDTEFIVNVPINCAAGDPIQVIICEKCITISCPHLARKETRFIVCFVDKTNRVTWNTDLEEPL